MKAGVFAVLVVLLAAVPVLTLHAVFAQQSAPMVQSGNKIDVKMQQVQSGDKSYMFVVTFLQPKTQNVQVHIDYDVAILQNGNVIFDAAKSTNQNLLHTAKGNVTIPYTFTDGGTYQVRVQVFGIVFNPITPETFNYDVTVTPEFSGGIVMVTAAGVVGLVVVLSKKLKHE